MYRTCQGLDIYVFNPGDFFYLDMYLVLFLSSCDPHQTPTNINFHFKVTVHNITSRGHE